MCSRANSHTQKLTRCERYEREKERKKEGEKERERGAHKSECGFSFSAVPTAFITQLNKAPFIFRRGVCKRARLCREEKRKGRKGARRKADRAI